MSFELLNMTTVRVLDVRTLAAKNRKPEDLHGMQMLVQALMPIAALAMFDPRLPEMLTRKAASPGKLAGKAQGELAGIEQLELTEIGAHVKRIPWAHDQTGCTIEFDRGLGGSSNLKLLDCTVHGVSFKIEKGVSAKVQWSIDAPSLAESIRGKLTSMKATELPMTQREPEVSQGDIEDSPAPKLTPAQLRQANAAGKTPEQALAEAVAAPTAAPVERWPFPMTPGGGPKAKSAPAPAPAAQAATKGVVSRRQPPTGAPYRDPVSQQTWSGKGLKPKWLTEALKNGKKLSDFETVKAH